ncbi:hypothetical protein DSL72_009229 [Monilinia vaccinii-corymbosi]|uniref:GDP/GTP exchange factor Sec2 N-terminal domain-containing protein n=1 Tax=Monilinia vaccinii-corymbosi TaxID=61207 RepID=A0A8A3PQR6_9HELO|nr:hypothetical protein DSL72_009229 [Monilinia vaccinii-corymbosi]
MSQTSGTEVTCPNCGMALPHNSAEVAADAQKQIEELQAQVRFLTEKATAAVDKWADYEDEIELLKRAQSQQAPGSPTQGVPEDRLGNPGRFSYLPVQNRFSSLLSRRSTPNLQAQPPPKTPSTTELVAALTREQRLRQAAEGKLNESSVELEELTAQLFTQANEMVATERKARAKLEERVELLEKRDGEKRKRLERLEGAMQRIERTTWDASWAKGAMELCEYAAESCRFELCEVIIQSDGAIYTTRNIFKNNNTAGFKLSSTPLSTENAPPYRATASESSYFMRKASWCI